MAAVLIARGASPDAAGAPWRTPLAWARQKGHQRIADALIAAGATRR
jgi:hypothetical protein